MTILVLSNDELKQELLSQPVSAGTTIAWLSSVEQRQPGLHPDAFIDLLYEHTPERITWLKQWQAPLTVINSVMTPLSAIEEDFVRINGWKTFLSRSVMEAACRKEAIKEKAVQLFALLGRKTEWTPDITGFITPRIVAVVINEAFLALEEEVSREEEMDTAMKLGTNYPYGPFEWGQKIGFDRVYRLLEVLGHEQKRYKPSLLLKQKILV